MGKAGGILGIIAGLLGIAAALFTLLVGGVGAAFEAKGASTVVGLGWGGVLFSFLVIIFGAVAFAKPKGAGIGLIVCSLGGMILGGTFVAVVLVLSLVGGLLAVFDKGAAKALPAAGAAESAAPAQSQDKPWGTGLLILGVIGALIYAVLAMRPQYVQPDDRFLKSELMVRPGISEVGLSVEQFVLVLEKAAMDNGKSPQLKGWTKEENEYTLHLVMKQAVELKFTHFLQPPINGQASLLAPIQSGLEQVPALQFVMSVFAMVPEQSKPKPQAQQAAPPAAAAQQVAVAPSASGKEIKARFGVVTVADDGVRKLLIDGKATNDSEGNLVEDDHMELVKYFALPDMDVIIIYSNCGGTICGETGRYRFLILGTSGQRSLSSEFGDGRDNATIENDAGKIVVGFGAKGMAVLDGGSIRISKELLP